MLKKTVCLLLALLLSAPGVYTQEPPTISAASAVVMAEDGTVVYEHAADEKRLIASTTKLMTALVVLENTDMEAEVEILPDWCGAEGSSMELHQGDRYRVRELLTGLLLASANDAAVALACFTAGSAEAFAVLMNERATALGMTNTHYVNPHGLDEAEHFSTARDLAVLMFACMQNEALASLLSQREGAAGEQRFENHNKLLWRCPGCLGGKTGYTRAAGRCLVSCVEREGTRFVCVTLSDSDDWRDHEALYDWAFEHYVNRNVTENAAFSVPVLSGEKESVRAVPAEELKLLVPRDAELTLSAELPWFVFAPIRAGEVAGKLRILCGGQVLAELPLVYEEDAALKTSA